MSDLPLISIITINFNDVKGLEKTMKSVFEQSYPKIEYIVIDGGSNDGSSELIEKYRERLNFTVSELDKGPYDAMNKGIDRLSGDYVLFLNSGDYLVNNSVITSFVEFSPTEDLVYGDTVISDGKGTRVIKMPSAMSLVVALTHTINHQTIFFSKRLFANGDKFDCDYKIVADWVFVANAVIFKKCTSRHIDLVIPNYDSSGMSSDKNLRVAERRKYLKSSFDDNFIDLLCAYNKLFDEFSSFKSKSIIKVLLKLKKIRLSLKPKF